MRSGDIYARSAGFEDNLFTTLRVVPAVGGAEDFDGGGVVGLVVVEHDARRDLFGFDDGGMVEAEVEGVGFFIDV